MRGTIHFMNIDEIKTHPGEQARLTYKLRNANVYVSPQGFHFTDYLDPVGGISPEIDASQLTDAEASYIESQLQANLNKFRNQVDILASHLPLSGAKVLDIGCGGGLFLSLLKERGSAGHRHRAERQPRPVCKDKAQP